MMQNVPTLPKLLTSPTLRVKAVAGAVVLAGLLLASVFSIRFALADATAANVDAAFTTAYVDAYRGGAVIKLSDQARWLDEIKHAIALAPANGDQTAFQRQRCTNLCRPASAKIGASSRTGTTAPLIPASATPYSDAWDVAKVGSAFCCSPFEDTRL